MSSLEFILYILALIAFGIAAILTLTRRVPTWAIIVGGLLATVGLVVQNGLP